MGQAFKRDYEWFYDLNNEKSMKNNENIKKTYENNDRYLKYECSESLPYFELNVVVIFSSLNNENNEGNLYPCSKNFECVGIPKTNKPV